MVAAADAIMKQLGVEPDRSNPVPMIRTPQQTPVMRSPMGSRSSNPVYAAAVGGKALVPEDVLLGVSWLP